MRKISVTRCLAVFVCFAACIVFIDACKRAVATETQQGQASQTPDRSKAFSEAKLRLNAEDLGKAGDTSALEKFLSGVMAQRYKVGIKESTVYIRTERSFLIKDVLKIVVAAKRANAYPVQIPVEIETKELVKPDLLALVISIGNADDLPRDLDKKLYKIDGITIMPPELELSRPEARLLVKMVWM